MNSSCSNLNLKGLPELEFDSVTPPTFVANPKPWMLPLIMIGAAVLLAGSAFWALKYLSNRRSLDRSPYLDIADNARTALEEIEEANIDFDDVIIRCYAEMSHTLQAENGIQRAQAMTTYEFEQELLARGIPKPAPFNSLHNYSSRFDMAVTNPWNLRSRSQQNAWVKSLITAGDRHEQNQVIASLVPTHFRFCRFHCCVGPADLHLSRYAQRNRAGFHPLCTLGGRFSHPKLRPALHLAAGIGDHSGFDHNILPPQDRETHRGLPDNFTSAFICSRTDRLLAKPGMVWGAVLYILVATTVQICAGW